MSRPLSSEYSLQLGFSFNKRLGANLIPYKKATVNQDFDCAGIIDGKEGSGKSVFAQQVAAFLDVEHKIDIDTQICWTPEQFNTAVNTLGKGKAIVWDEARRGLNRRRSTDNINIDITDMLAECRQNNLFMVIVMPTFYDMDMNVAVWRTRFLIHVYYSWSDNPEAPLERGKFRFYSENGKKNLYVNKHYRQSYKYPLLTSDSFDATFPHHYTVDEAKYRKKKRESENYYKKGKKDLWAIIAYLKDKGAISVVGLDLIANYMDVTTRTVYNRLKEASARNNS